VPAALERIHSVVEADRCRLAGLAQRLRDGRLKPIVGAVRNNPIVGSDRMVQGECLSNDLVRA
jgi:hypothetical protein